MRQILNEKIEDRRAIIEEHESKNRERWQQALDTMRDILEAMAADADFVYELAAAGTYSPKFEKQSVSELQKELAIMAQCEEYAQRNYRRLSSLDSLAEE